MVYISQTIKKMTDLSLPATIKTYWCMWGTNLQL